MFHLRFGLSDHLKALLDFVFGSRRRVKKVRIFRAWFSHDSINCLVGRLVGYVEMQKDPANRTVLNIPPAFRNDILRSKQVICFALLALSIRLYGS